MNFKSILDEKKLFILGSLHKRFVHRFKQARWGEKNEIQQQYYKPRFKIS